MYTQFFNSILMRPPPLLRTWLRLWLGVAWHEIKSHSTDTVSTYAQVLSKKKCPDDVELI